MKKLLVFLLVFLFAFRIAVSAAQCVKSYTKKNGTIVQNYMRSNPNKTKIDNYSTKGNINPYTGKRGCKKQH